MARIRLALIGCGAVTERGHIPALREADCFDVVAVVDRNLDRAALLAQTFGIRDVFGDVEQSLSKIDAAIVAVPHSLHAPIGLTLIDAGKHVLLEKPMAINAEQCRQLIRAANERNVCLAVGHMRRLFPGLQLVKEWLDRGIIGNVRRFDFRDGFTYRWPVASDFFFRKEVAGGGVLLDTGAHTLDTLLWLLGEVETFTYRDDSHGGVEADCRINLTLASGACGVVELSRTRILRNSGILEGEDGALEVSFYKSRFIHRPRAGRSFLVEARHGEDGAMTPGLLQMMRDQLIDWYNGILGAKSSLASAYAGLNVVALIEEMYLQRQALPLAWEDDAPLERAE